MRASGVAYALAHALALQLVLSVVCCAASSPSLSLLTQRVWMESASDAASSALYDAAWARASSTVAIIADAHNSECVSITESIAAHLMLATASSSSTSSSLSVRVLPVRWHATPQHAQPRVLLGASDRVRHSFAGLSVAGADGVECAAWLRDIAAQRRLASVMFIGVWHTACAREAALLVPAGPTGVVFVPLPGSTSSEETSDEGADGAVQRLASVLGNVAQAVGARVGTLTSGTRNFLLGMGVTSTLLPLSPVVPIAAQADVAARAWRTHLLAGSDERLVFAVRGVGAPAAMVVEWARAVLDALCRWTGPERRATLWLEAAAAQGVLDGAIAACPAAGPGGALRVHVVERVDEALLDDAVLFDVPSPTGLGDALLADLHRGRRVVPVALTAAADAFVERWTSNGDSAPSGGVLATSFVRASAGETQALLLGNSVTSEAVVQWLNAVGGDATVLYPDAHALVARQQRFAHALRDLLVPSSARASVAAAGVPSGASEDAFAVKSARRATTTSPTVLGNTREHFGLPSPVTDFYGYDSTMLQPAEILRHIVGSYPNTTVWSRFIVNIGAHNGVEQDPLYALMGEFRGLCVEMDPELTPQLRKNVPSCTVFEEQVTPQNAVAMLRRGSVPVNVDVIKVDIDSCDCQVADSVLHAYHPKVFLLEINPCFPPPVRFQQRFSSTYKWDGRFSDITSGCSLSQASEMMAAHGYTLLQVDYINACYVANEFADAFAGVLPATTLAAFHSGFSLRQGIGRYTWLPHIAPCLGQIQHSVNTFLAKPDAMPSADDESSEALLELTRASLAATARPAEAGAAPPFMLWA